MKLYLKKVKCTPTLGPGSYSMHAVGWFHTAKIRMAMDTLNF